MAKFILSFVVLFGFFVVRAEAALSPLSFSIVPPVQFPSEEFTITGSRISLLWGQHRNVYGIDVGLLGNVTLQKFGGAAIAGGVNSTYGLTTITGLQFAGLANINRNKVFVYGLQIALVMNANKTESAVSGLQLALYNSGKFTDIYGAQVGLYNRAKDVRGFQIGIVNQANSLRGLQIGLLNFNQTGLFKVSPLLNVGF